MNLLKKSLLPVALCLTVVGNGRADDDKKTDSDKDKTVTVHGVISAFTVVGEADLDKESGKLTTAEATLVTVIGHPWMHEGDHKEYAAAEAKEKSEGKVHAEHHHHRMNLYVAAMTPKTVVNEVMASGKTVALDAKEAKYDDLEIGDRVELTISLKQMKEMEKAQSDSKDKKTMSTHGRHRTFMGLAQEIKLMPDHMDGSHHDGKSEHDESKVK